jgi:hypothetical protein
VNWSREGRHEVVSPGCFGVGNLKYREKQKWWLQLDPAAGIFSSLVGA